MGKASGRFPWSGQAVPLVISHAFIYRWSFVPWSILSLLHSTFIVMVSPNANGNATANGHTFMRPTLLSKIEINVDCGEAFGMWEGGPDEELMPMIDAANIACGGHAGDPVTMRKTVGLAKKHGIKVGAREFIELRSHRLVLMM